MLRLWFQNVSKQSKRKGFANSPGVSARWGRPPPLAGLQHSTMEIELSNPKGGRWLGLFSSSALHRACVQI